MCLLQFLSVAGNYILGREIIFWNELEKKLKLIINFFHILLRKDTPTFFNTLTQTKKSFSGLIFIEDETWAMINIYVKTLLHS